MSIPPRAASTVISPSETYDTVTQQVADIPLTRPTLGWYFALSFSGSFLALFFVAVYWLLKHGVGVWGINIPVAWGFAITDFVWWIGIGHAGTFISAFLLLLHQEWRTTINRIAEAMTLFAVICAGLFPLLHLGRPWVFYFMLPYPDTMGLWPQWRSPLVWDLFAVATYFTVSLIFWYVGLVPDLATMRDRARRPWVKKVYGFFALGWRGSARQWHRFKITYLLLAGIATPLVISVHSVVGLDFAYAAVPGWHSTFFPPYFVAGAIFSGFAMVLVLAISLRSVLGLQGLITERNLDNMAKMMLATGLIVAYSYLTEAFMAFLSGDRFEMATAVARWTGVYAPVYWTLIFCNVVFPQLLWFPAIRKRPSSLFVISIFIIFGMWLERYMLIITSLYREYLPSSWGYFAGTIWDWATLFGSLGLFFVCYLMFVRFVPTISMSESRELVHKQRKEGGL